MAKFGGIQVDSQGNIDPNSWDQMVDLGIRLRHAIYQAGGMATKSVVENVIMTRFRVERYWPHQVMNHIEYCQLDQLREWRRFGPAPTLSEFPELDKKQARIKEAS